ncbi:galactose-1-phosphate uridylyltransferase [Mangrovactinospora gilvigrisea]|uniref:Galactose-1-phosphate uridylyltransferase n=1 Tax=Mangrovactinospora gilvigrisea TaxID=1428644 RepID=A0A1J7CBI0_9ACTN|nr:galactose-1-phosphate uridylyltransferase [Mangrovactinospora gilvigrisea]OIV38876.1 galactose-1-phosphate uridylyltransferase [Mangrovactinospora gilvigrisea]
MKKTATSLADGRELIYYDPDDGTVRDAVDRRPLPVTHTESQLRHDPLLDEWVVLASHRQSRTFHPPADQCPLCPTQGDRLTEIPDSSYNVAVFENRFPSLSGGPEGPVTGEPFASRPGAGRCEVVCFTDDHTKSFGDLTPAQARLVMEAWVDRTGELSSHPGVEQVFCFENRGKEIGVTLAHPHGQIYAYPFTTPRTERMLASAAAHRRRTGRNLFEDVLAAEKADGSRIVVAGEHWTAFVPHAAHWPYEVHLYPNRRVGDLLALDEAEKEEWSEIYLDLLQRFDGIFSDGERTPYISAWHQAPFRGGEEFALHQELFTIKRAPNKLKYLAGSESGMDVFINDVRPEAAAERLRELGA